MISVSNGKLIGETYHESARKSYSKSSSACHEKSSSVKAIFCARLGISLLNWKNLSGSYPACKMYQTAESLRLLNHEIQILETSALFAKIDPSNERILVLCFKKLKSV